MNCVEAGNAGMADVVSAGRHEYANENGAALVIVLVMLLLLTILGSTLLSTSTTDLQIAGNYRNNQQTFYINDYAYEFLKKDETVYKQLFTFKSHTSVSRPLPADPDTGRVDTVKYTVTNVGCSPPPPDMGYNVDDRFNTYVIDITATGPNNSEVSTVAGNMYKRASKCPGEEQ